MSINLALILTLLTALTGIVYLLDVFVWHDSKRGSEEPRGGRQTLVEYSRSFFPVLLIVLVIRSFVFEPFRIPSGSMMPTLLQGDFIFVKKFSYGLRLPVTETKLLETGSPERGDVVVFRLPQDPSINYIKRVVGLPGDTVVYEEHRLTINGELIELERSPDAMPSEPVYIEYLDGRRHEILITNSYSVRDDVYTVPEGHYFVMGDNRDNSKDSRFIEAIPESHLVGEAVRVWMHMDGLSWPRWDRIGTKIQ
ncbi:MAG: signal peptidase I [Gammaproteobacteria bacterium]|nr:signal peptidase I [Gammaproteobacteria bacterium]MDH3847968.1 signal peptidase I [Gammaproteobacteria bacterium]MDH3863845.1 signal peptidase I [Gammaproteobacteria bacterium]MDH3906789.1 signal peptidase I [Gammaproteobacteria bacterium]MDH3954733.1 signal peptidase I [Gammaproteobacteria bacterium]